jgi:hypothetical protein
MMRFATMVALASVAWAGSPVRVSAQIVSEVPQAAEESGRTVEEGGRYSFHRTGDTFLRLDSRTGQVSECGRNAAGWACTTVADERAALEQEIARLQNENGHMKKELLAKGETPKAPETLPRLPSDAELDRAMAFMKNVWRRLIEMMADLQRDMRKT